MQYHYNVIASVYARVYIRYGICVRTGNAARSESYYPFARRSLHHCGSRESRRLRRTRSRRSAKRCITISLYTCTYNSSRARARVFRIGGNNPRRTNGGAALHSSHNLTCALTLCSPSFVLIKPSTLHPPPHPPGRLRFDPTTLLCGTRVYIYIYVRAHNTPFLVFE